MLAVLSDPAILLLLSCVGVRAPKVRHPHGEDGEESMQTLIDKRRRVLSANRLLGGTALAAGIAGLGVFLSGTSPALAACSSDDATHITCVGIEGAAETNTKTFDANL